MSAFEDAALTTQATTVRGAIASLEWAASEFVEFYVDEPEDGGDYLIVALLNGALRVLRDLEAGR